MSTLAQSIRRANEDDLRSEQEYPSACGGDFAVGCDWCYDALRLPAWKNHADFAERDGRPAPQHQQQAIPVHDGFMSRLLDGGSEGLA